VLQAFSHGRRPHGASFTVSRSRVERTVSLNFARQIANQHRLGAMQTDQLTEALVCRIGDLAPPRGQAVPSDDVDEAPSLPAGHPKFRRERLSVCFMPVGTPERKMRDYEIGEAPTLEEARIIAERHFAKSAAR
jgi:hypothetical protein